MRDQLLFMPDHSSSRYTHTRELTTLQVVLFLTRLCAACWCGWWWQQMMTIPMSFVLSAEMDHGADAGVTMPGMPPAGHPNKFGFGMNINL
jgi:hypothetical protein